ncbi:Lrp/AsnC family transcriptional regulator [Conexibacter woesei]|uniref:Transcriptional regulator, AsnC family n=1 Tax=Conexibacter woesei (strain DSM 14684 / CCUG 47730 / CIP 108061 / JCM 11494 / NBRC 100937 / ID131577) TaxID=469383 RepID=D3F5E4_CONWI|nr:Lrp/AsnC family transcriptional regulator [Conexibacter woesei]ADB50611.1 transcriptional regulator, AsnC family [Conexibacter woesei DSM 14684]
MPTKPFKRQASLQLDEIDRAIISELQDDGRRTYGRIGKAVGLSEPAVRQRVARLIEADAIRIAATVNPDALGIRLRATVCLRCDGDLERICEQLSAIEEVDFLIVTAGSFDVMAQVQCSDDRHLYRLLNEDVRKIDGVRETETFIYLDIVKADYAWPPGSGRRPSLEPPSPRRRRRS